MIPNSGYGTAMSALAKSALIFFGAGFGALGRFWLGHFMLQWLGSGFPWSTLTINVSGSFLLGLLLGILESSSPAWALFLGVGLLGGYTTFSTFSYEAMVLIRERGIGIAATYVGASVIVGLLLCAAGFALGQSIRNGG